MKNQLLIINGKFSRDGKEEKPEFGNLDQIRLIKEFEEKESELIGDGFQLEPESGVTVFFDFTCLCGTRHDIEKRGSHDTDWDELAGEFITCKCKRKYVTHLSQGDELLIKLK